jgi:hypothetical protein
MYVDVSQQKMMSNGKMGQKMIRSDQLIAFNTGNPLAPGRYEFESQIAPAYPGLRWNVQKPRVAPPGQVTQPQPTQPMPTPQPQYQTPTPTPYVAPQPQYQQPMPAPMAAPQPTPSPQPQQTSGANNTQLLIDAIEKMADRICLTVGTWGQDISMKLDRNAKGLDDTLSFLLAKLSREEAATFQSNQQALTQRSQATPPGPASPSLDPNQTQFVNQNNQPNDDEPF